MEQFKPVAAAFTELRLAVEKIEKAMYTALGETPPAPPKPEGEPVEKRGKGRPKKDRKEKDPNRVPSLYQQFIKDHVNATREQNPGMEMTEVMKIMADMWKQEKVKIAEAKAASGEEPAPAAAKSKPAEAFFDATPGVVPAVPAAPSTSAPEADAGAEAPASAEDENGKGKGKKNKKRKNEAPAAEAEEPEAPAAENADDKAKKKKKKKKDKEGETS